MNKFIYDSYNDYNPSDIKDIVAYCLSYDPVTYSGCNSVAELLDEINNRFSRFGIKLVDADYADTYDDYGNKIQWSSQHILYEGTRRDGVIEVAVAAQDLLEDVENDYTQDWTDFIKELNSVLTHEYTHRYQLGQYHNIENDYGNDELDYLTNKEEMAARAMAAVRELIDLGYKPEQLLNKLRGNDLEWFVETNQLSRYYDFFYDDTDSDIIRLLKKYIYIAIQKEL